MKIKLLLTLFFFGLFGIVFLPTSSYKGTFHTDEPGNVMMSLNSYQSPAQIYHYAAITSQPPLDHFVRTYLLSYWGKRMPAFNQYPELFHRSLSLFWWLLPLGYFIWFFDRFSTKTRLIIFLGLSLMASSALIQFYMAEARHYSAIAAVMSAMLIISLVDRVKFAKVKYHFLLVSSVLPLLHLISFPFYLATTLLFLRSLYREKTLRRWAFWRHFGLYVVFWLGVVLMYRTISDISSGWQSPTLQNVIGNLSYSAYYFFRTLGFAFRGTVFFPLYKVIPEIISHHWPATLLALSLPSLAILLGAVRKQGKLPFYIIAAVVITFVWPLTFFAVIYRSNYFVGERYSLAVIPFIFFGAGTLLVNIIWKLASKTRNRQALYALVVLLVCVSVFLQLKAYFPLEFTTPENQLVHDRPDIFRDEKITIVFDNGTYSETFLTLALANKIGYKVGGVSCRLPLPGEASNLNEWLTQTTTSVYLFGPYQIFMDSSRIEWQYKDYTLYRLDEPLPEEYLCIGGKRDVTGNAECWNRCLKSGHSSADQRFFKYTSPHTDIHLPKQGEEWIP